MLGTFAIFLNYGNIDIKMFKNTLPHLNSLLKIMNKYSIYYVGGGPIRVEINLVMSEEGPMRPASISEAAHANYDNPNIHAY